MKLIFDILNVLITVIITLLNGITPLLLPIIIAAIIITIFRKYSIIVYTLTSMLSAFLAYLFGFYRI